MNVLNRAGHTTNILSCRSICRCDCTIYCVSYECTIIMTITALKQVDLEVEMMPRTPTNPVQLAGKVFQRESSPLKSAIQKIVADAGDTSPQQNKLLRSPSNTHRYDVGLLSAITQYYSVLSAITEQPTCVHYWFWRTINVRASSSLSII